LGFRWGLETTSKHNFRGLSIESSPDYSVYVKGKPLSISAGTANWMLSSHAAGENESEEEKMNSRCGIELQYACN
jgi:hypothetical protein